MWILCILFLVRKPVFQKINNKNKKGKIYRPDDKMDEQKHN